MFWNKSFSSCEKRQKGVSVVAQSNEKEPEIQINFPPENRAELIYFLFFFWLWLPRVPSDENTRNV